METTNTPPSPSEHGYDEPGASCVTSGAPEPLRRAPVLPLQMAPALTTPILRGLVLPMAAAPGRWRPPFNLTDLALRTLVPIGLLSMAPAALLSCCLRGGECPSPRQRLRRLLTPAAAALLLALAMGGRPIPPAHAAPTAPPDPEPPRCVSDLQVNRFTATPQTIDCGQRVPLTWAVQVPTGCSSLKLYLGSQVVPLQGTRSMQPLFNTTYHLRAGYGSVYSVSNTYPIANTTVTVRLPGTVRITSNSLLPLFLQAINTPNTTVVVENQVELNLSNRDTIPIAAGVTLQGGRTPRDAGPRLYTTTRPTTLFQVQGDRVRITGLRIEGPVMGVGSGDDNTSRGISINSQVNIEIDQNELFGWSGAAIDVWDEAARIDYAASPPAVHIHDNYIHNNQHEGSFGYGVVIGHGAYALIERNVFDWNRHAIAGDGSDYSGYRAYENLVLEHGGLHRWWLGAWSHTHQFDMHGQDNCGILDLFSDTLFNCGTAGHDIDIRRNAFLYTAGAAIKLRGTPQLRPYGAFVISNVFAHAEIGDAVKQNESGLYLANNQVGVDSLDELGMCDFDGDGIDDAFLATGQTWWYSSRGQGHWVYLNTSTKRRHEVTLGYFDGDRRCDVFVDGHIFSGGRP